MLYTQNDARIVATDSVTSPHPKYPSLLKQKGVILISDSAPIRFYGCRHICSICTQWKHIGLLLWARRAEDIDRLLQRRRRKVPRCQRTYTQGDSGVICAVSMPVDFCRHLVGKNS